MRAQEKRGINVLDGGVRGSIIEPKASYLHLVMRGKTTWRLSRIRFAQLMLFYLVRSSNNRIFRQALVERRLPFPCWTGARRSHIRVLLLAKMNQVVHVPLVYPPPPVPLGVNMVRHPRGSYIVIPIAVSGVVTPKNKVTHWRSLALSSVNKKVGTRC